MEIFHENVTDERRTVNVVRVGAVRGMEMLKAYCEKGVTGRPSFCLW